MMPMRQVPVVHQVPAPAVAANVALRPIVPEVEANAALPIVALVAVESAALLTVVPVTENQVQDKASAALRTNAPAAVANAARPVLAPEANHHDEISF